MSDTLEEEIPLAVNEIPAVDTFDLLSEDEKQKIEKTVVIAYKKLVSTKIIVTSNGVKREYEQKEYDTKTEKSKEFNTSITELSDTARTQSEKANTLFAEGNFDEAQVAAKQAMKSAAEARAIGDKAQKLWEKGGKSCT
jgi:hypothetical protein